MDSMNPSISVLIAAAEQPQQQQSQTLQVLPDRAKMGGVPTNHLSIQWIGLRENLQETMVFTIKYRGFL